MAQPDYNSWFNEMWGWPDEFGGSFPTLAAAANIEFGTNPPYSITDFFSMYPKFGGIPANFTYTSDGIGPILTNVSSTANLAIGQYIAGAGIPSGATISAIDMPNSKVTISVNTTSAQNGATATVYVAPLLPTAVINAYVAVATASLIQARYCELWLLCMALYIAHLCTLWLQTESVGTSATGAQAAATGLAIGIKTAKSVGDVSVGLQVLNLEEWGAFALTAYGQELIGYAKAIGSGGMLLV